MGKTVQHEYRGWEITIRCNERYRHAREVSPKPMFSATAQAALQEEELPANWIDSRVQMVDHPNRSFTDEQHCIDTLLSDVCELIDALKR